MSIYRLHARTLSRRFEKDLALVIHTAFTFVVAWRVVMVLGSIVFVLELCHFVTVDECSRNG